MSLEAHKLQPLSQLRNWLSVNRDFILQSANTAKAQLRSKSRPLTNFSPPYLLLTEYRGQNGISLSRRNPQKASSRPELRPISPVSLGMLPRTRTTPDEYHLLSLFLHLGPVNVIYLISSRITLGSLSGSIGTLNFASFLHFPYLFS